MINLKIRKGFVTNSSSSSFLIAIKKDKDSNYANILENLLGVITIKNKEELKRKYWNDDAINDENITKYLNEQYSMILLNIDYGLEYIYDNLSKLENQGSLIILEGE